MLFEFTQPQKDFRDSVAGVLERHLSAADLRQAWESGRGSSTLWSALADAGFLGLLISESRAGSGGTQVDLELSLEEAGYHAVPAAVIECVVVAPALLRRADRQIADDWLPAIARGERTLAIVSESSHLAPFALDADAFVVKREESVFLVPRDAATVAPVSTLDHSLGMGLVSCSPDHSMLLGKGQPLVGELQSSTAWGTAALLVGLSQRMLDLTCDYVRVRRQFGRQIGSYQAVKHRLADVAVSLEAARSLTWYAAYALATSHPGAERAARSAKALASQAADEAGRAALQLHGAIGFTWDHDLHLYLQRARALQVLYGTAMEHRVWTGRDYLRGLFAQEQRRPRESR